MLTSHLGCSKNDSEIPTHPGGALVLPKPEKRPRSRRQNFEREKWEKIEKQELHKKVEHDRRDLIKHWTLFLEELLPSALKSDPEVRAKNGKPNLPKKIVYQLACKYICNEQGRQDDYETMLRAQPNDQSSKCSETAGENPQVADGDGFDGVRGDLLKASGAGCTDLASIGRNLVSPASSYCAGKQEKGPWFADTTNSNRLLGVQP